MKIRYQNPLLLGRVISAVFGVRQEHIKIVGAIVRMVVVDMMHLFRGQKNSTQEAFNYQSMFIDIASMPSIRVSRLVNLDIAPRMTPLPALPMPVQCTRMIPSKPLVPGFGAMLEMIPRFFVQGKEKAVTLLGTESLLPRQKCLTTTPTRHKCYYTQRMGYVKKI